MENPFSHNRATNVIGKVLDAVAEQKKREAAGEPMLIGPSLEARIAHALEAEGLLNEKAMETVGLAGRFGHPETADGKAVDSRPV